MEKVFTKGTLGGQDTQERGQNHRSLVSTVFLQGSYDDREWGPLPDTLPILSRLGSHKYVQIDTDKTG